MPRKIPPSILCLTGGALMPLAYAPYNIFFIAIVVPAILLLHWSRSSPVNAFRCGYLFGLGMFGVGVSWLHISINMFGGVNIIGSIWITALLVAYLSLYPALVGYIGRRWFSRNDVAFLLVAVPALWVISEWARAWVITGFPWLNLGYSQVDSFLSALAPLFGVYGVSWLTIFISALLVCLYRYQRKGAGAVFIAMALLAISCWSLSRVNWTTVARGNVAVALVQGGIPQELKWRPELREKSLALYLNLSAPYWDDELVIWPETAIPAYSYMVADFIEKLKDLSISHQTTLLAGIPSKEAGTGKYFNSVIMLSAGKTALYRKKHLVPFGEYLPLKPVFGLILNFLQIPMSDFSPGEQAASVLFTRNMPVGISICYEDTFGEEVIRALPAAQVLVNVSNDAWFGDSMAPHQHLQMARMRALESGRYLLRATNTGISAIIDEKGRILKRSPQFRAAALSAPVKLFTGSTPYSIWSNIPVIVTALLLGVIMMFLQKRKAN